MADFYPETIASGSRNFAKEVFHVKQRLPAAIHCNADSFILRETTPCKVARATAVVSRETNIEMNKEVN
jgi:uncharacterized radical SAM superfamily Fe-S cluster-containing enzyme